MKLFGRQFWIVRLLGIAAAAGMAGSAASSALALVIIDGTQAAFDAASTDGEEDEDEEDVEVTKVLAATAPKSPAGPRRGLGAAAATLDHYNPFCPGCVDAPEAGAEILAQGPSSPSAPAVATRLPLRLHATMEAERAKDSLATIYDTERTIVGVFAVGDEVRPGAMLASVGGGHVVLRTAAGDERLQLGAPAPAPEPAPAAKEKPKALADAKDAPKDDGLDAISCATEDVCTVERAFVDEILANPAKFAASAPRVAPAPGGGFKLSGIRKGSLGAKLGLKTGDVLVSVNGAEIQGIDDALALMTKLRRATNLEVILERKGASVRKAIEIK